VRDSARYDGTNGAELDALAARVAADWYRFQLGRHDVAYDFVAPWVPDALTDVLEFTDLDGCWQTRAARGPWDDWPGDLFHLGAAGSDPGAGTVTSVGLAMPPAEFAVAGSPVTTSGTFDVTLASQTARTVWAGPTAGSPASVPTFRVLQGADLPTQLSVTYDAAGLKLVGDVPTPPASHYYGTGSDTTAPLGYHPLPVSTKEGIWRYDNSLTMADPGSGRYRWDATVLTAVTRMAIDILSDRGIDFTNVLKTLRADDQVEVQDQGDAANWVRFRITADPTNNGTWFLVPVTLYEPNTYGGVAPVNNEPCLVVFAYATGGGGAGGGTVTSVALSAPAEFTVSGSPVTGAGTLAFAKVSQGANLVYAGPTTGAGPPTFRPLTAADVPAQFITSISNTATVALTVAAGQLTANVGAQMTVTSDASGLRLVNDVSSPGNSYYYGTNAGGVKGWYVLTAGGTVTAVALSTSAAPEFIVGGSPITTAGTLTLAKATQAAHAVWAGPSSGTTAAAPTFRTLVAADLPLVPIAGGGTGQTTANAAFNALAPAQPGHASQFLHTDGTNTDWRAAVTYQMSITSDVAGLKLVNDVSVPGASYFYGTDGTGTKGWHPLPGGAPAYYYTTASGLWDFNATPFAPGPGSDPGPDNIAWDASVPTAVAFLYVSTSPYAGAGAYAWLFVLQPGDVIWIADPAAPSNGYRFLVNGPIQDFSSWFVVPVRLLHYSGPDTAPAAGTALLVEVFFAETVPAGGAAGQVLNKQSAADYDTGWVTPYVTAVSATGSLALAVGAGTLSGDVRTQMSIGQDANGLALQGDAASPGGSHYYGTDAGGIKGWQSLIVPAATLRGNNQGAAGPVLNLTPAEAAALLPLLSTAAKGLAPQLPAAAYAGALRFLRDNGGWYAPQGQFAGQFFLTADEATSSTTDVDLANPDTMTFDCPVAGGVILLYFSSVYAAGGVTNLYNTVYLNGAYAYGSYLPAQAADRWQSFPTACVLYPSQGTNTVQVRHRVDGFTGHWQGRLGLALFYGFN
jgi:hypothetical protein